LAKAAVGLGRSVEKMAAVAEVEAVWEVAARGVA
jgi:hypothetical protein